MSIQFLEIMKTLDNDINSMIANDDFNQETMDALKWAKTYVSLSMVAGNQPFNNIPEENYPPRPVKGCSGYPRC